MRFGASYDTIRLSPEAVAEQRQRFLETPVVAQTMDLAGVMILLINSSGQTIAANQMMCELLGKSSDEDFVGKRPGEVLHCVNSSQGEWGCGSGNACEFCGAADALLRVMKSGREVEGEAAVVSRQDGQDQVLNVRLRLTPFILGEELFFAISFMDITADIQKRMLERTFFHDVTNTMGGLRGLLELLKAEVASEVRPEVELVERLFVELLGEIQSQKILLDAENGDLLIRRELLESREVLQDIKELYHAHEQVAGKRILVSPDCVSWKFFNDPVMVRRILGNMVKNALEASQSGDAVTMGCTVERTPTEKLTFWVHNKGYMKPEVQHQLFNRAFSTKGQGRGIGTYSMKLLGERFLNGQVSFTTDRQMGTRFFFRIPISEGDGD